MLDDAVRTIRQETDLEPRVGVVYLGLAAVLGLAMSATYVDRDF